ncbi:hypothetical protein BJ170DRAFT_455456 [Xylariales sp. AK1849]|nr:hypothetical protein BJ170DRAFT_455456 [Xylariales sp. AK1849]
MSNSGGDTSKQASPLRRRQHVSRSITETSAPKLHRHHHLLHQRRHQDRNSERTPQSATPYLEMPPRASLDFPRSEVVTPYLMSSAEQSRRTSMLPPGAEEAGILDPASTAALKEKALQIEREHAASRIAGLKKSLMELNTFSITTTRHLDDTYYAVLEKLGMLQTTIIGIKELAGMSQETNEVFKVDSQALVTEIESQLGAFGQIGEQQERIETLQTRIYAGRGKAQKLSERVDIVRERVEGWERADREWQEKTRKRLKVVWIITSVLALLILLLFIGTQYVPVDVGTTKGSLVKGKLRDIMSSNSSGTPPSREELTKNNRISEHLNEDVRAALNRTRGDGPMVDENILRAFDEL